MKPRARRHNIFAPIILTARGMGRHFTVTNVSASGAALKGEKKLNIGETVIFNYTWGRIDATVRWAKQHDVGVMFKSELNRDDLNRLLRPARTGTTPSNQSHLH